MEDFSHVKNDITRAVLKGERIDEDSICQALTFASFTLHDDRSNETISLPAYILRCDAFNDAHDEWNKEGGVEACVEALKRFWGN